ncbi:MAG TPA: PA14 domain-containing protein [Planctomycetota bacterium]|nr:PA14 domain-containing protein [Planctomycetota bacterium]
MSKDARVLGLVVLALWLGCANAGGAAAQSVVFPASDWQVGTPESQGMDSAKVQQAVTVLSSAFAGQGKALQGLVVIRNGVLIAKSSDENAYQLNSATKSFTSTCLGLLIEDGKATLNTLAKDYNSALAPAYPAVTLRHFATMTSGYDVSGGDYDFDPQGRGDTWNFAPPAAALFAPGSMFRYWDEAFMQNGNVLTRIAGEGLDALFKRRIADPIGMTNWRWVPFNSSSGTVLNWTAGMTTNARQLARFGYLFLNRGNWNGRQLIGASWVDEATRVQVPLTVPNDVTERARGSGTYGYNWWINGIKPDGTRLLPGATPRTYMANGYNSNVCIVVPEYNLVLARTGDQGNLGTIEYSTWGTFVQKLVEAIGTTTSTGPSVSSFTLVNADTEQDLGPIVNGATLDLASLPTRNLNVRANTSPSTVGSVRLTLDGNATLENAPPYTLFGDSPGDYAAGTFAAGAHTLTATPYSGSQASGSVGSPLTISFTVTDTSVWRLGLSHDGNQHDPDDILAVAMGLAMVAEKGLTSRLVHCDYNNHLGDNNPAMAAAMAASAAGAAQRWGIPASILFNDQANLAGAVASIRNAVNASSSRDRFYLVCAGPMEVAWRGLAAADPAKRSFCTIVSHSAWNDDHADTPEMTHRLDDLRALGAQVLHLPWQAALNDCTVSSWTWLRDSSVEAWRWLYSRNDQTFPRPIPNYSSAGYFDCSDSGMVYFVLSGAGDLAGDPTKVQDLFQNGPGGFREGGTALISFTLVNADTDEDLGALTDGAALNLAVLPTRNLNLRATTAPATVGSVRFDLDGALAYRIESVSPYALQGDNEGDYAPWTPAIGSHTVTATPFSAAGATGSAGSPLTVTFTVSDNPTGGSGLKGEYFDNQDLTNLRITRTDATVDFNWGSGSPDPVIAPDTFSVRWSGQVEPPATGTYVFTTTSNDGIRLWVNGQLLINNWTDHLPTEDSGAMVLVGGQKVAIRIEYYEGGGTSVAKLSWSGPGFARTIVPQNRLYPQ